MGCDGPIEIMKTCLFPTFLFSSVLLLPDLSSQVARHNKVKCLKIFDLILNGFLRVLVDSPDYQF